MASTYYHFLGFNFTCSVVLFSIITKFTKQFINHYNTPITVLLERLLEMPDQCDYPAPAGQATDGLNIGELAALEHSAELGGAPSSLAGALVDFVIYQPLDIERIQRETYAPFTVSTIALCTASTFQTH